MTVADLIAELRQYPPEAPIVVRAEGTTYPAPMFVAVERSQTPHGYGVAILTE